MLGRSRQSALRHEPEAALRIPYTAHIASSLVKTTAGHYLQAFRLGGASFESIDDVRLNAWHERLNVLWRNIASPNVALWTHVIRRRERAHLDDNGAADFANALHRKYRRRLAAEVLMVNELYLAVLYRPTAGAASTVAARMLRSSPSGSDAADDLEAVEACGKLGQAVSASLMRYEPELLGTYCKANRWYSSLLEFLGLLINAEWHPVPLPCGPLNRALCTSRVLFGSEAIEYRAPSATRVGAMLGIKEYPAASVVGMYDRLLSTGFPLVLTQSFTFISKAAGQGLLLRQANRMANAGDHAVSQAQQLNTALDALSSNEFAMGDHHLTLQVMADIPASEQGGSGALRLQALNANVATARALLADTGMTVAREDLALEAAFWAQLPGNFAFRPRKAPVSSRNFAAMVSFHNYPCGRAHGNHWGDALALLMSSARSPYYFSLHASDPNEADGGSRKDTGHTLICGPTGSGKTVFVGFMVAMLSRMGVSQVIVDKDRGLEVLVRALGGDYLPLCNGEPTGCNPLQLPNNPEHLEFLKLWLRSLARPPETGTLTVRELAAIDQALRDVMTLAPDARRLSRLIEHLDATDPGGIHARLAPWCEVTNGAYAWVFDNPTDAMIARLSAGAIIGIDVTDFLNHELARPPLTLYLFHLIRQLLDGRRLVCWLDEFWRLLADPAFAEFAKDAPKTWRKLNGAMCFATQSTSDVLASSICRTVVEQTATKVFFPNPDASASEYMESFGLSEREFGLIKEHLEPGARQFLVKQGHYSAVCQLDLQGFEGELAVLAARRSSLTRMRSAVARHGNDPSRWLSAFLDSDDQT
jgi:type IV secretion system protein VirB4